LQVFDVIWCPRPESNRYAPFTEAADFKSDVSTNFTTRASRLLSDKSQTTDPTKSPAIVGRRGSWVGGATRSRTGLDGFAIRCITDLLSRQKKGKPELPFFIIWSGKRVSNSRPQPWQGCALPTELFPRFKPGIIAQILPFWQALRAFVQCLTVSPATALSRPTSATTNAGTGATTTAGSSSCKG
jgi:hypothetical protein